MAENYDASCACGKVHFTLDEEPHLTFNCHCTICRKMNGSAFSTYAVFSKDAVHVTEGKEDIRDVRMGVHGKKHFCHECGAPLYLTHGEAPHICLVALGAIDDGGAILPIANAFCRSKLNWAFEIDALIQHERDIPG